MSDGLLSTIGPVKTGPMTTYKSPVQVGENDTCDLEVVEVKNGQVVADPNRQRFYEQGHTIEAVFYLEALGRVNQCQNNVSVVYYTAK